MTAAALAAAAVAIWPHGAWAEPAGAGELLARAGALLRDSYAKAPALVIGLGALLLIPPLAFIGLLLRRSQQRQTMMAMAARPEWEEEPAANAAFVEVEGATQGQRMPIDRQLLQIGRQDDNDICIDESTVHRYHAIIERSEEHGLVITDVSGPEGNGVKLNGEKVSRAGLVDGDLVELGAAKLRVIIPKSLLASVTESKAA